MSDLQKECPICMEIVSPKINCLITECGHTFHTSCLLNNIIHNKLGCPYCRKELLDESRRFKVVHIPLIVEQTGTVRNWLTERLDLVEEVPAQSEERNPYAPFQTFQEWNEWNNLMVARENEELDRLYGYQETHQLEQEEEHIIDNQ